MTTAFIVNVTDLTALRYRACNTCKSSYYYAKLTHLAAVVLCSTCIHAGL
jgi:hypothetical protein